VERRIDAILKQPEHRIVSRGPRADEKAKSEEAEEAAGFNVFSKTPFHSKIHGLVLPKVVIILPWLPSHFRVPSMSGSSKKVSRVFADEQAFVRKHQASQV
jgi:hypothetical protein